MGMDGGRGENVGTSALEFNGTGIFTGSLKIGRCFHFILSPYPKARVICVPNRDIQGIYWPRTSCLRSTEGPLVLIFMNIRAIIPVFFLVTIGDKATVSAKSTEQSEVPYVRSWGNSTAEE